MGLRLCVSGGIYAEYEEVIRRPRLKRSEEMIVAVLQAIRDKALWVRPRERVKVCMDPDDDIFLECAQARQSGLSGHRKSQTFPGVMVRNSHRNATLAAGYFDSWPPGRAALMKPSCAHVALPLP